MPLFEYKCGKCGHHFEKIEKYTASAVKKCPECGAKAERQLAAPAIQFKGSGWYVTDYGGKGSAAKPSDGSGDGTSDKSTGKSPESKSSSEKSSSKGSEKSSEKSSSKSSEKESAPKKK